MLRRKNFSNMSEKLKLLCEREITRAEKTPRFLLSIMEDGDGLIDPWLSRSPFNAPIVILGIILFTVQMVIGRRNRCLHIVLMVARIVLIVVRFLLFSKKKQRVLESSYQSVALENYVIFSFKHCENKFRPIHVDTSKRCREVNSYVVARVVDYGAQVLYRYAVRVPAHANNSFSFISLAPPCHLML